MVIAVHQKIQNLIRFLELLMDTKAILTDMHNHFDVDENKVLNLTEVFKGYVSMLELMGVKIKADFKESVASIAEMIRMSNSGEIFLPKRNIKNLF